jgi:hypothetical protein
VAFANVAGHYYCLTTITSYACVLRVSIPKNKYLNQYLFSWWHIALRHICAAFKEVFFNLFQ